MFVDAMMKDDVLSLSWNKLGNDGVASLADALKVNTGLLQLK